MLWLSWLVVHVVPGGTGEPSEQANGAEEAADHLDEQLGVTVLDVGAAEDEDGTRQDDDGGTDVFAAQGRASEADSDASGVSRRLSCAVFLFDVLHRGVVFFLTTQAEWLTHGTQRLAIATGARCRIR